MILEGLGVPHAARMAPQGLADPLRPSTKVFKERALAKALAKTKHQGQWVMAKGKWANSPTHAVAQSAVVDKFIVSS